MKQQYMQKELIFDDSPYFWRKPLFEDDKHQKNIKITRKLTKSSSRDNQEINTMDSTKLDQLQQQNSSQNQKTKIKNSKKHQNHQFSWSIWKKLFKYTLNRKGIALLSLLLSILYSLFVSLLPLKVGQVLDYITSVNEDETLKNIDDLNQSVWHLGIMVACLGLFTYLRYLSLQFLQQFLAMDMRNEFYTKFIQNDMYFFQKYKSGELVSRLSSDINQAKSAVSNNITFFIRNLLIVLINIVILFTISWKLAFFVMILVPFYSYLTLIYSKRNKILVKQYQDNQAEVSAVITQKFSGIQLVKAYSNESTQIDNYKSILLKGYEINKKKILLTGIYNSVSEFLPYIGILITLWYGGSMVIKGSSELTAGQLTSFILYCSSLANSTSNISNSYTNIINGTHAVQKLFDMLEYVPKIDEKNGSDKIINGEITFNNVTFQYPTASSPILKNLNLKIRKGEYIAFVGESGSGKSTIVKLIQKFYKISEGQILFDKTDINDIKAISLRKQIGLVNQEATMFSGTISKNITYGLDDYSIQQLENAAQKSGCLEFIKNSKYFEKGFETQVSEKGNNLSGGQRQRISIARALIRKPKIIVFDEATSALDSNSEQMVQKSIQGLALSNSEQKPTIIVIAHRLSTVINANRIIVMRNGEIVETGNHKQLRDLRGYYYQLIEKQLSDNPEHQNMRKNLQK